MSLFYGRYETVTRLIKQSDTHAPINVNARDNNGCTPLHLQWDGEIVKVLIQAGFDVNAKDAFNNTPLHWRKDSEATRALIKAGADVNAQNNDNMTPLHFQNDSVSLKVLILAGADVNSKNNAGVVPLNRGFAPVKEIYREIVGAQTILSRFFRRNFKYFGFRRWIKSKEGVEWLYHPRRGGKYAQKRLLRELSLTLLSHKCNSQGAKAT